ncbi:hypothetical protein [Zobellia alginiliquefaciens]|uniref:hypothetical protein n=1 Tax=Zobellia alginiliquefaciens TaxID=3032586 RepID=UPI0023E4064A|nr:hypothetical protein [Zobellia alginiliquefaciens]
MPSSVIRKMLGKRGNVIWQHANSIDKEPVKPYTEKQAVYMEHDFEMDSIDIHMIGAQLMSMVEQLALIFLKPGP